MKLKKENLLAASVILLLLSVITLMTYCIYRMQIAYVVQIATEQKVDFEILNSYSPFLLPFHVLTAIMIALTVTFSVASTIIYLEARIKNHENQTRLKYYWIGIHKYTILLTFIVAILAITPFVWYSATYDKSWIFKLIVGIVLYGLYVLTLPLLRTSWKKLTEVAMLLQPNK